MRFISGAMLALVALAIAGCDNRVHCEGWAGSTGPKLSAGTLTDCSDGKDREVSCTSEGKPPYACTCTIDGTVGNKFERTAPLPGGTAELGVVGNDACGWGLK